jgi:hypothetical protein
MGSGGDIWAQGSGHWVNEHSTEIIVVVVIAGSLAVCNAASETCAALILAAAEGGGIVCVESEESCQEDADSAVSAILNPNGQLIGGAGSQSTIRELPGGEQGAQAMFNQLSAGGQNITPPSYPGTLIRLSDGTVVGIRNSDAGVPTIDVNIPGDPSIMKLKFP